MHFLRYSRPCARTAGVNMAPLSFVWTTYARRSVPISWNARWMLPTQHPGSGGRIRMEAKAVLMTRIPC